MEKEHSRQKEKHVQIFHGLIYCKSAKKFSVTGPLRMKGRAARDEVRETKTSRAKVGP